jgi:hypothetical protein
MPSCKCRSLILQSWRRRCAKQITLSLNKPKNLNYGLVHEKQMVDMDRNGRLPRLSNFCEYLLYAGVG